MLPIHLEIVGQATAKYSGIIMETYISFFFAAMTVPTANEMALPVYFTNDIERQVI